MTMLNLYYEPDDNECAFFIDQLINISRECKTPEEAADKLIAKGTIPASKRQSAIDEYNSWHNKD